MFTPADVVEALAGTGSRIDKERILQLAWDNQITEFFEGVQVSLDALVSFGVKQVPLIADGGNAVEQYSWIEFKALRDQLANRSLTGHAARDALRSAAERAPARDWNLWYRRLLLKDLKAGVTETTINKVLNANGAEAKKFLIPVFSCQLAKPAADHPKKMTGPKLLDYKADGIRLLSVLDKENNTVRQFTREGRENTNFGDIVADLEKLLPVLNESVVLDGEMISSSFQTLMTQVNRKEDVDTTNSSLMLFDIVPLSAFRAGIYKVRQADRHLSLCELIPILLEISNRIQVAPKLAVNLSTPEGQAAMAEFNRQALSENFEGIMVKDPAAFYQTKRSDAWLKIKPDLTVDLTVVGVEPGTPDSKFASTLGNLVLEGEDLGRRIRVEVGSGFTEAQRDEIWAAKDSVIGRVAEIKADALTKNQSSDDIWSLRFPVFLRWRGLLPGEKL
jgi:DNA ligase 1